MKHITEAELITGYVLTWGMILVCVVGIVALLCLAWSVVYPILVFLMGAL